MRIQIFTDGSVQNNPGNGGWAALIKTNPVREISGSEKDTTNNRMEVTAALKALKSFSEPVTATIITDSEYLRLGITEWIHLWKKKNWKTARKKDVKNADLWRELDEEVSRHDLEWEWLKSHSGHPENERVDELAKDAWM